MSKIGMKKKIDKNGLIAYFKDLILELERGVVVFGEKEIVLPDDMEFEIESEEERKKGQIKREIEWEIKWQEKSEKSKEDEESEEEKEDDKESVAEESVESSSVITESEPPSEGESTEKK